MIWKIVKVESLYKDASADYPKNLFDSFNGLQGIRLKSFKEQRITRIAATFIRSVFSLSY